MYKDPSLKEIKHSLEKLERILLLKGLTMAKSDISNEDCVRMEIVVDKALLEAQNVILRALKVLNTPELLSLIPTQKTNN
jgi:hypothetical protein